MFVLVLTRTEAEIPDQPGVAGTKPVAELGNERLQIFPSLLWGVDVSEKVPQSVGKELVTEIMERHQLVQDVSPAQTNLSETFLIHSEGGLTTAECVDFYSCHSNNVLQ